ncbi:type VI secretion system baseplate subunit TssF [Sphingomonas sp. ASY06-1R]|uniref:type VI secretion system baseplate subunit TssF n=1 Tax=Sphingomonas sp. ASY06-1R TaxID=3445771 RepID=UPI003FA1E14C
MFDDILPYYNSELRFMRDMAKAFAEANPKIAGRLRIAGDQIDDPHVARLIEGFAFLNARTRMKLDDDFPELTTSLLDLLYPHYLRPFPSMAIMQLTPQAGLQTATTVPAGAELMTEPVGGEPVRFRTGYPVEMWPVRLSKAAISGLPLLAPQNRHAATAQGVLRLTLETTIPDLTFAKLGLDRLRFYIASPARTANMLYELITGSTLSVAVADDAADPHPVILPPDTIRPVGFAEDEVLVPLGPASDPAHALMTEYFGFAEKFLFFDLTGLDAKTLRDGGRTIDVFLYLDRFDAALERQVSASDFRLFATPVVNLFRQQAEPVRLIPGRYEHRIVPDARREATTEVYSVDKVSVADRGGTAQPYFPFYAMGGGRNEGQRYWRLTRRAATNRSGGDDVFLSTVDSKGVHVADADHVASITLTCTNRNLAADLPRGDGRPRLTMLTSGGQVDRAVFLTAPTHTQRPERGHGALWRLISHLSLNHMSIADPALAIDLVRELLALHDSPAGAEGRRAAERLRAVHTRPATARAPAAGRIAFVGGTEIMLEFEDRRLSGSGVFLLGALLDRVFASMAAINSFSRTTLMLKGEKDPWQRWNARTGTRALL